MEEFLGFLEQEKERENEENCIYIFVIFHLLKFIKKVKFSIFMWCDFNGIELMDIDYSSMICSIEVVERIRFLLISRSRKKKGRMEKIIYPL